MMIFLQKIRKLYQFSAAGASPRPTIKLIDKLKFGTFLMQKIIVKPPDLWYNKLLHKNHGRWHYGKI